MSRPPRACAITTATGTGNTRMRWRWDGGAGNGRFTGGCLPPFPPAAVCFPLLVLSAHGRTTSWVPPSACVCVCVFTPDCYGRMWWFSSKPECLRKIKWLPVRIFTFSVNVLKWNFFGKKHRKPSSLDSSSGSSVSSYVWPPATKTENDRKADKQIIHQRVLIIDCVSFHCENELLLFHHIITKTSCLTAD